MEGFHFLGIYSGNPPKDSSGMLDVPSLWNVYLKQDNKVYVIQKLDKENKPTAEQYKISPAYFGVNFRQVKNAPLKRSAEKTLQLLDTDKDKHESFFASFFKNHSAFNSIFQHQNEQPPKKKTNEFSFQMGTTAQKNPYKTQEDDITLIQSPSSKQSKEFQLNLSDSPQQKEQGAAIHENSKQYNPYDKNTDQHPFDEKFCADRFGLDTVLNSLNDPKKQPQTKEKTGSGFEKNLYGLKSKQLTPETVLVHHRTGREKTEPQTIDGDNEFFNNLFKEEKTELPATVQTAEPNTPPGADEGLLPAKGNKTSISQSEKAQKLDNFLRAEFQVSLNHWYMSKKNMALRQFHNIINKEANFVPAHKHMFTDFAIQLRKINQHDLALVAAIRCTKLSPDDSHAFFNVARLYYELGRYEKANEYIDRTLNLEHGLAPAVRLSAIIKECLRRKAINK